MTPFETELQAALSDRADQVRVAPDAWEHNQELLGARSGDTVGRRSTLRSNWRLPLLVAAAVVVLVIGVTVALQLRENSDVAAPSGPAPVVVGGTLSGCPDGAGDLNPMAAEILDRSDNATYSVFLEQPSPQHPTVCLTSPRLTDAVTLSQSAAEPLTLVVRRGTAPYLWGVLGRSAKELRITVDDQHYRYWGTIVDGDPDEAFDAGLGGGWPDGNGFAGGLPAGATTVTAQAVDENDVIMQSVRIDLKSGSIEPGPGPQSAQAKPSALTCPAELGTAEPGELWVPSTPINRPDRLVPDEVPVAAVTCHYARDYSGSYQNPKKTGPTSQPLSGDLQPMVDDLRWWPTTLPGQDQTCSAAGSSHLEDVLLGLTYSSGEVIWLAADAPLDCTKITNGFDKSFVDRSDQILQSAKAGRWLSTEEWQTTCPKDYYCEGRIEGRWGQQEVLVPDRPSTVVVSRSTISTQQHPTTGSTAGTKELDELTALFNALPISGTDDGSCEGGGPDATTYSVLFTYESGPSVRIRILTGCDPSVGNGSLGAIGEGRVTPLLDRIVDA